MVSDALGVVVPPTLEWAMVDVATFGYARYARGLRFATKAEALTLRTETALVEKAVTVEAVALLAAPTMVKHHIFNVFRGQSLKSQLYRDFFKKHGIKLDNYCIELTESMHRSVIHSKNNNWTTAWKNFIDANPSAKTKEVYQFAGELMDRYGVSHLPIVKYR